MGVVIRRWVWLETIGVVSGCFPHITYIFLYIYCTCICSFLQQHPYFCFHFVKMIFRSYIYNITNILENATALDERSQVQWSEFLLSLYIYMYIFGWRLYVVP